MIEQLAPVVAAPALIAAAWTMIGLRLMGRALWVTGGIVAAGMAGALVVIAAFLPLVWALGSLAVPVLSVGGGMLLMVLFARFQGVAAALAVPFAVFVLLQPQWFPLALPLILVLPLWTVGWIERDGGAGPYALALVAALIVVPIAVFGGFLLLRGGA